MISLVLAMTWARRGQAITLALLTLLAVASAVAAPAYLLAVDRAVAAGQVATAAPNELGMVISARQNDRDEGDGGSSTGLQFAEVGQALVQLPGFHYVYSAEFPAIGVEPDPQRASRLVFRQETCEHVTLLSGRCLIGAGDVLVGERTADRLDLAPGDPITLGAARFNPDPTNPIYLPDGEPARLTVVGVYRATDITEAYWGTHGYFTTVPGRGPGEPMFTGAATQQAMDHGDTDVAIDGTAGSAVLDVDRLGTLRGELDRLKETSESLGAQMAISTRMPDMLDRIDRGREAARLLVPVIAVPLVLLACFSIFLAVGYSAQGRQNELAVVALRGPQWWVRWWITTGESLVAVVAGAVVGCLAGQLLVNLVAALRFPGVGADPGWSSLRYAPLATLLALAAAVAAQRRQLLGPVSSLLRRGPASGRRIPVTEAVATTLAVAAGVQLVLSGGELTGVGLLAPALLVLAVSLLVARALVPVVTRYAARALRRGHPGAALAAYQLSRRPGAERVFALLVATVAVAGYAAAAVDTAERVRHVQAAVGTGAARVLTVSPVHRQTLLGAVRAIDPEGRYAMAVAGLAKGGFQEPAGLAVDSTRLAAVMNWPDGAPDAAAVARLLRPDAPAAPVFPGQDVQVVLSSGNLADGRVLRLNLAVSSVTGLGDEVVQLGQLSTGRSNYVQRVDVCREGCRLNGIGVSAVGTSTGATGSLVLEGLGSVNPVRPITSATLTDPAAWRTESGVRLSADPAGLRIDLESSDTLAAGVWVQPADAPAPMPVAHTGTLPDDATITGLDRRRLLTEPVAELPTVPRLGRDATLVDLEYADRVAVDGGAAAVSQVWLNDSAPPDVLDRIAEQGLTVIDDVAEDRTLRQLDQQGPALSLWFFVLAAVLVVLLGAGGLVLTAAVDRRRRVEDLSALRAQGLSRTAAGRATLWTYPLLVLIATVAGLLVAALAWELTGWTLPLAGVDPPDLPLPGRPGPFTLPATGAVVLAVLTLVALVTGNDLRRRVR
ncbi:FtsX-like permease family protein [Actinoplanes sp. NBRC 101535]|uniref:FtsX-like permease family protein n=1 Tax=Actinoplanes sp. NBRC 101535 TaxID=3032196 RepID=UPI0024A5B7E8|nr:FtsX-like permease family protein [Actinoplanes sp. NBRC 101535]GLY05738.1 hypothetical protein Acsp01_61170 [Actinoplanes sp. NBRC 101535]